MSVLDKCFDILGEGHDEGVTFLTQGAWYILRLMLRTNDHVPGKYKKEHFKTADAYKILVETIKQFPETSGWYAISRKILDKIEVLE